MQSQISPINLSEDIVRRRVAGATVSELLDRFLREMEVDHVQYYGLGIGGSPLPVSLGTFTERWLDRYITGHYFFDDPVMAQVKDLNHALPWERIQGLNDRQIEFMEFTRKELGRNGVTVPVGTPPIAAGLSIVSDESPETWKERLPQIIWNATMVGQRVHTLVLEDKKAREESHVSLSRPQKACLYLAASGMGLEEIAQATSMGTKSVIRCLNDVQAALNARNHTHALAKAVALGLVVV
jgi:ATP-dependent transcriptional regulator